MFRDTIDGIIAMQEFYELLVKRYEAELQDLPEGSLCRKTKRGRTFLYHYRCSRSSDGSGKLIQTQRYLSKKEDGMKTALKRRRFIEKSLPYLYDNIDAAKNFLKKYKSYDPLVVANNLPIAYAGVPFDPITVCEIPPGSRVRVEDIENWKNEPYEKNELFPEKLKHGTSSGIKVRSKSECIIAELLDAKGIPFRYEAALELNGKTYYPDFTILRPKDGKIMYWEHFGMTDDTTYNNSMMQKLATYNSFGITLWNQLIATFEGKDDSFDVRHINKIIELLIL